MSDPQGQASVNVFEQIDAVCKDFRRQWKKGPPPRIEDFVESVGKKARENLFRNLLHVDIEARRRAKEQPGSDDYIQRFPDFARIIRQAFFQSTMASMSADNDTSRTITIDLPAANRLGEYLLIGELEERLTERLGSLKELFGVLQQVAGDAQGKFASSLTQIHGTERNDYLLAFAQRMGQRNLRTMS